VRRSDSKALYRRHDRTYLTTFHCSLYGNQYSNYYSQGTKTSFGAKGKRDGSGEFSVNGMGVDKSKIKVISAETGELEKRAPFAPVRVVKQSSRSRSNSKGGSTINIMADVVITASAEPPRTSSTNTTAKATTTTKTTTTTTTTAASFSENVLLEPEATNLDVYLQSLPFHKKPGSGSGGLSSNPSPPACPPPGTPMTVIYQNRLVPSVCIRHVPSIANASVSYDGYTNTAYDEVQPLELLKLATGNGRIACTAANTKVGTTVFGRWNNNRYRGAIRRVGFGDLSKVRLGGKVGWECWIERKGIWKVGN